MECLDKVVTKQIHDQQMESQHFLDYYSGGSALLCRWLSKSVVLLGHFTWN